MKIKKMIACVLIGALFAGIFTVGFSISCGVLTSLQGFAIMLVGGVVTFGFCSKIEEEK